MGGNAVLKDFSREEFDIVIQGGQSNAEGSGFGAAAAPFAPCDSIYYLNNDFTICMAQERVMGNEILGDFSLSFCTKYMEKGLLLPGRKLLVVRAAVGGTGFLDNRWKTNDDLFIRMMEMIKTALELNPKNKLVAFIWHQGETDACFNASNEVHFDHLSTLVNTVRSTFACESLPFVAGDFVQHWKMENIGICIPVIAAIKEVCQTIGNARFVETGELKSNDQVLKNQDNIHFCRESLYQLGVKYFNAFCDITACKK